MVARCKFWHYTAVGGVQVYLTVDVFDENPVFGLIHGDARLVARSLDAEYAQKGDYSQRKSSRLSSAHAPKSSQ